MPGMSARRCSSRPSDDGAPVRVVAVIGVDVLADQGEFADAGVRESLGLGHDLCDRSRDFGAARVGHHAEGAELVAAFLHRDEGRNAAAARRGAARRGEMVELVLDRELGLDRLAVFGPGQHRRQAVIALRPDHEVDAGRAADDLFAFGLRHATGDRNEHTAAVLRGGLFQHPHAADLGIDLLHRLFADVAGVQHDQVGVVGGRGLDETLGRQCVRHTMRIVDVHLAAEGFDEKLAGSGHAVRVGRHPANFIKLIKRFGQPTERRWGRARRFFSYRLCGQKEMGALGTKRSGQRRSPGRKARFDASGTRSPCGVAVLLGRHAIP